MVKDKLDWIYILRAFSILLVVMFHVQLIDNSTGENHIFCKMMSEPFDYVRMPLFIFYSGALLQISRLSKGWRTIDLYKDKFIRILIPFVFFVIVYYFVKVIFSSIAKSPSSFSISEFIENFYIFYGNASAPLWFLATLISLMLMYPIFRLSNKNKILSIIILALSTILYFFDFEELLNIPNYFKILSLNKYFVFFFLGILSFKYNVYTYLDNVKFNILNILLLLLSIYFDFELGISISGIALLSSLSVFIVRIYSNLFASFRNYIYQIFLMSMLFQGFVELVLWKKLFYNENLFYLFYIINILFGIYMPVFVSKIIERCPIKIIRICFGLGKEIIGKDK